MIIAVFVLSLLSSIVLPAEVRGEEHVAVESMLDPEAEEVRIRGAGVVELVGEDMNGEAGREGQGPTPLDPEEGGQPDDQRQFVGVEEEEILPVFVVMGGSKKFTYAEVMESEMMKIFEEMIQVDKNSGDKKSYPGR